MKGDRVFLKREWRVIGETDVASAGLNRCRFGRLTPSLEFRV